MACKISHMKFMSRWADKVSEMDFWFSFSFYRRGCKLQTHKFTPIYRLNKIGHFEMGTNPVIYSLVNIYKHLTWWSITWVDTQNFCIILSINFASLTCRNCRACDSAAWPSNKMQTARHWLTSDTYYDIYQRQIPGASVLFNSTISSYFEGKTKPHNCMDQKAFAN